MRVTAAEFVRQFGQWQDRANEGPVFITHHGRNRHVLVSAADYADLRETNGKEQVDDSDPQMRLDTILTHLADGFLAVDRDLRITIFNAAASEFFNRPAQSIIGKRIGEIFPELIQSFAHANLLGALVHGEASAVDAPSVTRPNTWLHMSFLPLGDGAGCLFRNISDEVRRQRLGSPETTALAAMTAHGGIGRGRLSPRATFVEVDEALAGMVGLAPAALIRARLTDIMPLRHRALANEHLEALFADHQPVALESALLTRDGTELPVRLALAELRGDYASEGAMLIVTPADGTRQAAGAAKANGARAAR